MEKALRAFLVRHDVPFPKTHDLGKLGQLAAQLDATLDELVDGIVDLSKYAWMFRYPGDPVAPSAGQASAILTRAASAVKELHARIAGPEPAA